MIQRIQSIYLLVVLILSMVTLLSPVMELASADAYYELSVRGLERSTAASALIAGGEEELAGVVEHAWMLTLISAIIPLITLITIWLYKHRQLQIRLTVFNSLLMLGYYGMYAFYLYYFKEKYAADAVHPLLPAVFPLVCIVLNVLAIRGIAKDDALVKSYERLR